jgi:guanylate kinase
MIVLIGASASGKTEVAKTLISKHGFSKIVTYTTREIRPSEKNGVDYHFVSKEKFLELKEQSFFLETTTYNNNFYGTPKNDLGLNKVIILEPNGFKALKEINDPTIISYYILDNEDNRRRHMLERGDDPKKVEERIINDRKEFSYQNIGSTTFVIQGDNLSISQITEEVYKKYMKKLSNKKA